MLDRLLLCPEPKASPVEIEAMYCMTRKIESHGAHHRERTAKSCIFNPASCLTFLLIALRCVVGIGERQALYVEESHVGHDLLSPSRLRAGCGCACLQAAGDTCTIFVQPKIDSLSLSVYPRDVPWLARGIGAITIFSGVCGPANRVVKTSLCGV